MTETQAWILLIEGGFVALWALLGIFRTRP
jgi:hypothetical protein